MPTRGWPRAASGRPRGHDTPHTIWRWRSGRRRHYGGRTKPSGWRASSGRREICAPRSGGRRRRGQWEIGARLAVALVPFWEAHAHLAEGVRWLRAALAALPAASAPLLRVRALNGAGRLAYFYEAGAGSDYAESERYQNESLALAREAGDRYGIAAAFIELGMISRMRRDAPLSMTRLMEALAIFRELNDEEGIAWALTNLGTTARLTGDYAYSRALLTESLALLRALGDHRRLAIAHTALGLTAMQQGQLTEAAGYFAAALTAHLHLGDRWFVIYDVMGIAEVFLLRGQPEAAVRLIGAAGALAAALGSSVGGVTYEPMMATIRSLLGEARFAAIHAEGAALTLAAAAALALALAEQPPGYMDDAATGPSPAPDTAPLTRREQEIARLLARGETDRQIADALFIGVGTVGWHVHRILQKLDLQSRHQVAAWLNAREPHDGAPPKTGQKT